MLDYRGFDESLGLTEMGVDRLTDSRLNHGFFLLNNFSGRAWT